MNHSRNRIISLVLAGVINGLALAAVSESASANAAAHPDVQGANFSVVPIAPNNEIKVFSDDGGATWTNVVPSTLRLWQNTIIETSWPGYVHGYRIFLGTCAGNTADCAGLLLLHAQNAIVRDLARASAIDLNPATLSLARFTRASCPRVFCGLRPRPNMNYCAWS